MWKIARFTLREVVRKRLLLALALLTALYLGFFFYGIHLQDQAFERRAQALGMDSGRLENLRLVWVFVVIMGLYMVNFLGSLVSVFSAVGALSGELESGTLLTIVTKPLRRAEIVLGKWLGFAILSGGYMALTAGILLLGTRLMVGYLPPQPVQAVLLLSLGALLLLSLTLLGSALLPTLTNGIVMVMLYGMAWTGGILGFIGNATNTPLLVRLSEITGWAIPSDTLWRAASYFLQTEEFRRLQESGIRANPFTGLEAPTLGFLLWVVAYMVAVLAVTIWVFQRRDL